MKNLIGILILLVLSVSAYFIYQSQNGNEAFGDKEAFKDFAIEDTAAIDKIFISQPNGKQVTLTRRGFDKWMVNGKFPARPHAVGLILKTAHDIKVQMPVSKKTFEGVVRRLASGSTKVEYFLNGSSKAEKTWYVGDPTGSRMGTYMLLEKDGKKSSWPYVTYLLMERGFLGPRFFLDPELWKDRVFVRLDPPKIKSLTIKHQADSMIDFKLEQVQDASFVISKLDGSEKEELSPDIAIPYLKKFKTVYYEYIDRKTPQEELDSIYNSEPRHEIIIEMQDGNEFKMRTHYLPVIEGATVGGKPIDFHPERMYAYSSYMGNSTYPIVQNLTFDPLLVDYEELTSSTNVEK